MAGGTVELQVVDAPGRSAVPLLYPMHPSSGDENGLFTFTWQHNDRSATKNCMRS